MITIKIKGGLGNQIFQYAVGRALSLKLNTKLFLDDSWFKTSDNRTFELKAFNLPEECFASEKKNIISNFFGKKRTFLVTENSPNFDANVLELRDNTTLDGYWQSEKYFISIEKQIRDELTLKNGLDMEAKEWADKIMSCEAVSLHIRRGDYLQAKYQKIIGVLPIEHYKKAVEIIKSKVAQPTFFVFSDDINWAKENLKLPEHTEFVSGKKMSAPEEMILMSLCTHNITANSSFSWWGAWLNAHEEKIVIVPDHWFNDPKMQNDDLVPNAWIKI